MELNEIIASLKDAMEELSVELEKFVEKNTKVAAKRVRKATLEVEKIAKQFRKESVKL